MCHLTKPCETCGGSGRVKREPRTNDAGEVDPLDILARFEALCDCCNGSGEVPLLEMTDAYAVFADQGMYHKTTGVISIKDKYGSTVQTPTNFFSFLSKFSYFFPKFHLNDRPFLYIFSMFCRND